MILMLYVEIMSLKCRMGNCGRVVRFDSPEQVFRKPRPQQETRNSTLAWANGLRISKKHLDRIRDKHGQPKANAA
jgi:hypothetical protein